MGYGKRYVSSVSLKIRTNDKDKTKSEFIHFNFYSSSINNGGNLLIVCFKARLTMPRVDAFVQLETVLFHALLFLSLCNSRFRNFIAILS